jgi:hypothetical protein
MTISQTPFLPDVSSDEPIPVGRLAYLQERTRNLLFEFVLNKFLEAERDGLTKAKLARRIHHSPSVITRMLGSPGNWRISTVSDLLAGICGEELLPDSIAVDGQARRNTPPGPDWYDDNSLPKVEIIEPRPTAERKRMEMALT